MHQLLYANNSNSSIMIYNDIRAIIYNYWCHRFIIIKSFLINNYDSLMIDHISLFSELKLFEICPNSIYISSIEIIPTAKIVGLSLIFPKEKNFSKSNYLKFVFTTYFFGFFSCEVQNERYFLLSILLHYFIYCYL